MIDDVLALAPNLCHLDLYIHFPPHSDLAELGTLRGTLEDHQELSELFSSISSKTKSLQHIRLWFWESGSTSNEDADYLEGVFRDFIRQKGWEGSLSFVWGG